MKYLLPTLALALGLSASTPALAQQPAAAGNRDKSAEAVKLAYLRQIAELKYDDLPLEEIVRNLRKDFPEINFILPEELGQVQVRLELRNVTLPEILQAIQIAGRAEHLVSEQTNERLFTFRRDDAAARRETPKPALRTFNLNGYLFPKILTAKDESAREEAVGKALRELDRLVAESWVMLREADPSLRNTPPPRLRMHTGTQMLISVGNLDQLRVIEEIVSNLPGMERFATDPATGAQIPIRPSRTPGATGGSEGGATQVDQRFLERYGPSPAGGSPTGTGR